MWYRRIDAAISGGNLLLRALPLMFIIFYQVKPKQKTERLTKSCIMTGVWCPSMRRRPSRNLLQCQRRPVGTFHTRLCSEPWSLLSGRKRGKRSQRSQWLICRGPLALRLQRKTLQGHHCKVLLCILSFPHTHFMLAVHHLAEDPLAYCCTVYPVDLHFSPRPYGNLIWKERCRCIWILLFFFLSLLWSQSDSLYILWTWSSCQPATLCLGAQFHLQPENQGVF